MCYFLCEVQCEVTNNFSFNKKKSTSVFYLVRLNGHQGKKNNYEMHITQEQIKVDKHVTYKGPKE